MSPDPAERDTDVDRIENIRATGGTGYTIRRRLAVGGMAELLLADRLGRLGFRKTVVIKRLLKGASDDGLRLFLAEAHLAARFNHTNLVQVYDLDEIDGEYGLVMEYLEGVDLRNLLDRLEIDKSEVPTHIAALIAAEAAAGLQYAHALADENGQPLRIVHRDVAPANIFLTWIGGVKVVDFGIAKHVGSVVNTETGFRRGRITYMSPEHAAGIPLDARSDIFSLGVVLFEMLTTYRWTEYDDRDPLATSHDGPHLSDLRPDLPDTLTAIVERMLAKDPDARYASAGEVADDLRTFLSEDQGRGTAGLSRYLRQIFLPGWESSSGGSVVPVPITLTNIDALENSYPGLADTTSRAVKTAKDEVSTTDLVDAGGDLRAAAKWGLLAFAMVFVLGIATLAIVQRSTTLSEADVAVVRQPAPEEPDVVSDELLLDESTERARPSEMYEPLGEEPDDGQQDGVHRSTRASSSSGTLMLQSDPPVEVLIAGDVVGSTPLNRLSLPPGTHTLTVRNRQHGIEQDVAVVIRDGRVTRRTLEFQRGRLDVEGPAGLLVSIDGRAAGELPLTGVSLFEGIHRVLVENPEDGSKRWKRVEVRAQELSVVDFGEPRGLPTPTKPSRRSQR